MKMTNLPFLGEEVDVRGKFHHFGDTYFIVDRMEDYCPDTMTGMLHFKRMERKGRYSFNGSSGQFTETDSWTFPPAYPEQPFYQVQFSFHGSDTFRLQTIFDKARKPETESLMIERLPSYHQVETIRTEDGVVLTTSQMEVAITFNPFAILLKNSRGDFLTKTLHSKDSMCLHNDKILPLSYVHTVEDRSKYSAISLRVSPGEHFYGCGESFIGLDKVGEKLNLFTKDPHGTEVREMYKPVPFYMSSRGYGVFAHTSVPLTVDLGHSYQESQTIFAADGALDLFFFVGNPKEVLTAYTALTGRAEMLPRWSFGLWMSRITYKSEAEARGVVENLKKYEIPCDVIHLDTGWFEHDWRCDYQFSESRFDNPAKMLSDFKADGYRVSLWQIPYFTPMNPLYPELLEKGYGVKDGDGYLPTDDIILDFSNPDAVAWYQEKLKGLFDLGVAAIKTDFGEAAPLHGAYASGKSGKFEHNLYPLRYNKAVAEATKKSTGNNIVWARSAWAGSQRYPLHWGGDTENTNMGMLSALRGGLSLGMSGFTFWSHDLGGFVRQSPEELYSRWAFMGMFTSHVRAHGAPPKEPWEFSAKFLALFRKQMEFRYRLTPYVLAQSINSADQGHPVMRSMFLEYPQDKTCYALEDQYFFGEDILVAPLFEENAEQREIYLPQGGWLDLFTKEYHQGGRWHTMRVSEYNGIALVKENAAIPMVDLALTIDAIDWSTLAYEWYGKKEEDIRGLGYNPETNTCFSLTNLKDIMR